MDKQDLDKIVEDTITQVKEVLCSKQKQYALANDVLHNFTVAGRLQGISRAKALGGMLAKHIVSVYDMIDTCDSVEYSDEYINEKIGDSINYLILLKAILNSDRRLSKNMESIK